MRIFYTLLLAALLPTLSPAQGYQTNGDATELAPMMGARCFRLTAQDFNQLGSVWNTQALDLRNAFELRTRMYFGNNGPGADGIAFMLQQAGGTGYLGNWGAGIGYHRWNGTYPSNVAADNPGPVPSVIIEFDTYQNDFVAGANVSIGDPAQDHLGFMSQSNAYHNSSTTLRQPETFHEDVEDGQWHDVTFTWSPVTNTLAVAFRLGSGRVQNFSYSGNIISNQLAANPFVYWGFTASTGQGSATFANEQKVCVITPVTPPPPPPACGQLRTQTPGGWGAKPAGNNPGTYLYANFARVFNMTDNTTSQTGLIVGSGGNTIRLTSPKAVTAFLPSGGKPASITGAFTDPGSSIRNTLAGHLVALTLSVSFDRTDAAFAPSGVTLGSMIIRSGPFAGKTVGEFLAIANRILGGIPNTGFTVQQALETATAINENYVDGLTDKGFLRCPTSSTTVRSGAAPAAAAPVELAPAAPEVLAYPNPTTGPVQVRLQPGQGMARIEVLSPASVAVEGRSVRLNNSVQTVELNLSRYSAGFYLIRVVRPEGAEVSRVVLQK